MYVIFEILQYLVRICDIIFIDAAVDFMKKKNKKLKMEIYLSNVIEKNVL